MPIRDSDLPYHTGTHKEIPSGQKFRADMERKYRMQQCMCRLCYLCLYPPQTEAIYQSHGLDKISKDKSMYSKTMKWSYGKFRAKTTLEYYCTY